MPTENLEAYEAYLKARQLMEVRNSASLTEAKSLFEKAIELDSNFALAYVHLGSVHLLFHFYAGADFKPSLKLAWEYLEKGMTINDNLAEAYALKGNLIRLTEKDLEAATTAFEKAISINPNYETTYHWYANTIRDMEGDHDRAFEIHKKAIQINPLSPVLIGNLATYFTHKGDYQKAIQTIQKGIIIEPAYPEFWNDLRTIYSRQGKLDSAAIYAFQGIQKNSAQESYLSNYLFALQGLGMYQELKDELNTLQPNSQIDSFSIFFLQSNFSIFGKKL